MKMEIIFDILLLIVGFVLGGFYGLIAVLVVLLALGMGKSAIEEIAKKMTEDEEERKIIKGVVVGIVAILVLLYFS